MKAHSTRNVFRRIAALTLIAAFTLALPVSTLAQAPLPPTKPRMAFPELVTAGEWNGTWFYVNRDLRFALWFRTAENGDLEMRARHMSLAGTEGFITDWQGVADYYFRTANGRFELTLDEKTPDRLTGHWHWKLATDITSRDENADIQMYRVGNGRSLAIVFENFARVFYRLNHEVKRHGAEHYWVLRKASKRIVLWEEIPF